MYYYKVSETLIGYYSTFPINDDDDYTETKDVDYTILAHTQKISQEDFKEMCDNVTLNAGEDLNKIIDYLVEHYGFQKLKIEAEYNYTNY